MSLASISCITITLIVVALSVVLSFNVEKMTKHVSSNMAMVVWLKQDFDFTKDGKSIEKKFNDISNVNKIKFKSQSVAIEEWKEMNPDSSYAETWTEGDSPLLESYEITVDDVSIIGETAAEIEKMDFIDHVNYGKEYIKETIMMFDIIERVCIIGVAALVLVTAFLISNTIKLAIFSRKTEIEIMRLVGASNISIKIPFLIEGSFIGFFGAIIPIFLICYGYGYFYDVLDGNLLFEAFGKLIHPYPFIIYVSGLLLLIGLLVGMFGSSSAVKKYLKI